MVRCLALPGEKPQLMQIPARRPLRRTWNSCQTAARRTSALRAEPSLPPAYSCCQLLPHPNPKYPLRTW